MNTKIKLMNIRLGLFILCSILSFACQPPASFKSSQKHAAHPALKQTRTEISSNEQRSNLELYSRPRTAEAPLLSDSLNEASKNLRKQKDKEKAERIRKEVEIANQERGSALTTPRRMSTGVPHHPRYMDAKSPELITPQPGRK